VESGALDRSRSPFRELEVTSQLIDLCLGAVEAEAAADDLTPTWCESRDRSTDEASR